MIIKAQKRKHPPEDGEESDRSSPTWESQRQFVFSVSLNKYQSGQVLPEPSLRRSVLIANTLRLMSLEDSVAPSADMEVSPPPCDSPLGPQRAFAGDAAMSCESPSALGGCPLGSVNSAASRCSMNYHPGPSNVLLPVREEDEDWGSMSTDSDYSLSAAITSILTALDSIIDGSPQAAPRTPLRSLENLMGPCEGAVAWAKQGGRGYAGSWEQQVESSDLFQDIDTSLLERDMGVLGLIGSGGGYQARDDFYQYLPPFSSPYTPCPSLATRI
ncbi:SERTA domain-containing protein 3 [Gasterosteus aculeatus]|uniref:SERTA domain-containing protein 3 n=1 Tax=Gasterosteus aculeatus aculeatus TaxID=481459 RepID=UPI001A9870B2|nr:SERTA domain-containing protein 3 [Gasterosteus aculeatus aculeatus]